MKKSRSNLSNTNSLSNNSSYTILPDGSYKRKRHSESYKEMYYSRKNFQTSKKPINSKKQGYSSKYNNTSTISNISNESYSHSYTQIHNNFPRNANKSCDESTKINMLNMQKPNISTSNKYAQSQSKPQFPTIRKKIDINDYIPQDHEGNDLKDQLPRLNKETTSIFKSDNHHDYQERYHWGIEVEEYAKNQSVSTKSNNNHSQHGLIIEGITPITSKSKVIYQKKGAENYVKQWWEREGHDVNGDNQQYITTKSNGQEKENYLTANVAQQYDKVTRGNCDKNSRNVMSYSNNGSSKNKETSDIEKISKNKLPNKEQTKSKENDISPGDNAGKVGKVGSWYSNDNEDEIMLNRKVERIHNEGEENDDNSSIKKELNIEDWENSFNNEENDRHLNDKTQDLLERLNTTENNQSERDRKNTASERYQITENDNCNHVDIKCGENAVEVEREDECEEKVIEDEERESGDGNAMQGNELRDDRDEEEQEGDEEEQERDEEEGDEEEQEGDEEEQERDEEEQEENEDEHVEQQYEKNDDNNFNNYENHNQQHEESSGYIEAEPVISDHNESQNEEEPNKSLDTSSKYNNQYKVESQSRSESRNEKNKYQNIKNQDNNFHYWNRNADSDNEDNGNEEHDNISKHDIQYGYNWDDACSNIEKREHIQNLQKSPLINISNETPRELEKQELNEDRQTPPEIEGLGTTTTKLKNTKYSLNKPETADVNLINQDNMRLRNSNNTKKDETGDREYSDEDNDNIWHQSDYNQKLHQLSEVYEENNEDSFHNSSQQRNKNSMQHKNQKNPKSLLSSTIGKDENTWELKDQIMSINELSAPESKVNTEENQRNKNCTGFPLKSSLLQENEDETQPSTKQVHSKAQGYKINNDNLIITSLSINLSEYHPRNKSINIVETTVSSLNFPGSPSGMKPNPGSKQQPNDKNNNNWSNNNNNSSLKKSKNNNKNYKIENINFIISTEINETSNENRPLKRVFKTKTNSISNIRTVKPNPVREANLIPTSTDTENYLNIDNISNITINDVIQRIKLKNLKQQTLDDLGNCQGNPSIYELRKQFVALPSNKRTLQIKNKNLASWQKDIDGLTGQNNNINYNYSLTWDPEGNMNNKPGVQMKNYLKRRKNNFEIDKDRYFVLPANTWENLIEWKERTFFKNKD